MVNFKKVMNATAYFYIGFGSFAVMFILAYTKKVCVKIIITLVIKKTCIVTEQKLIGFIIHF